MVFKRAGIVDGTLIKIHGILGNEISYMHVFRKEIYVLDVKDAAENKFQSILYPYRMNNSRITL